MALALPIRVLDTDKTWQALEQASAFVGDSAPNAAFSRLAERIQERTLSPDDIDSFLRQSRRLPRDLKHHLLLVKALLLLQRGRGDEALKQCEAALKIRDNALTQYLRSLALFATRRDDEGFQALQRAYDLKEGIEPPKEILLRELLRNWSLMALCLGVFGALAQKPAELEKPVAEYIRVVDNAKAERLEDAVIDVPLPKKFSSYLWGEYERQFRDGCFHAGLPVTQEAVAEVRQQFQEAVEELELAVRLLSIKDPFEGWRALTKEISKVWPEGVSALDAIREQRDREWNK